MKSRRDDTILLVDDDDRVRSVLGRALRHAGYSVLEANNGLDAFDVVAAHAQPVDLIVTDIMMPGINGLQLLQRFRGWYPAIRVLVISGYTEFAKSVASLEGTPTAFLGKPFTGYDLVRAVEDLFAWSNVATGD
jgi:CheY-like chemotaxis protein